MFEQLIHDLSKIRQISHLVSRAGIVQAGVIMCYWRPIIRQKASRLAGVRLTGKIFGRITWVSIPGSCYSNWVVLSLDYKGKRGPEGGKK